MSLNIDVCPSGIEEIYKYVIGNNKENNKSANWSVGLRQFAFSIDVSNGAYAAQCRIKGGVWQAKCTISLQAQVSELQTYV